MQSITAHIRWCLTGTPIQNSLEDLSALVEFLRVPILNDRKTFRKYITMPVLSGPSARFRNLRRLLEIICLRRTKSLLELPEPTVRTHMIDLSRPEKEAYADVGENCRQAVDRALSGRSFQKVNYHIMQTLLKMRLFCNDGPRAFASRKSTNSLPSDPDQALSYLQTCGIANCAQCQCEVQGTNQVGDISSGTLTICEHLICGECLPLYEKDLDDETQEGRTCCPICGIGWARDAFFILNSDDRVKQIPTGPTELPTKLKILLKNLQQQDANDKR